MPSQIRVCFITVCCCVLASNSRADGETTLLFDLAHRIDDFDWSIASADRNPDVMSELVWRDLEILQLSTGAQFNPPGPWQIEASFSYGWIQAGSNRDSDYDGPGRTAEYSRSHNTTDGDNTIDITVGMAYRMDFGDLLPKGVELVPRFGFSHKEQNLRITDGVQVLSSPPAEQPLGPFPDLNSTFQTEWKGPWLGMTLASTPLPRLAVAFDWRHHWADYRAQADWNLRSDLAHPRSFSQTATAEGDLLAVSARYRLKKNLKAHMGFEYHDWVTDAGLHFSHFPDETTTAQPLNQVSWSSRRLRLGLEYDF